MQALFDIRFKYFLTLCIALLSPTKIKCHTDACFDSCECVDDCYFNYSDDGFLQEVRLRHRLAHYSLYSIDAYTRFRFSVLMIATAPASLR